MRNVFSTCFSEKGGTKLMCQPTSNRGDSGPLDRKSADPPTKLSLSIPDFLSASLTFVSIISFLNATPIYEHPVDNSTSSVLLSEPNRITELCLLRLPDDYGSSEASLPKTPHRTSVRKPQKVGASHSREKYSHPSLSQHNKN